MQKKTVISDKLYFPKKPNYEYTSEYFASKSTAAHQYAGGYNNGDCIERNVEITNYLVQRHFAKTSKKLENKRKDYNDKRNIVEEQWEDLRNKEASLRQNFIKFNQFVKENQEKKERAANKIIEQNQLKEERHKRAQELHKKCNDITDVKAKMDKNIAQYRIYEDYLVKVVEREESMQSINDLLKRYEALVGARKDLNDMQQRDLLKLERAKSNLKDKTEHYLNTIATMRNYMNTLHEKYENAHSNCQKWERIHKYSKLVATEKVIDLVAIKESCMKMYLEICKRKKIKPTHVNNVEKQLFAIKQAIGEYEIINMRIKDDQKKALKESVEPQVSKE